MKRALRDNGLSIALIACFLLFLVGEGVTGFRVDLRDRQEHGEPSVTFWSYLGSDHFLSVTMENWESEFLQMGAYVFMTAYLFQRGSSESKDPDEEQEVDRDPGAAERSRAPWPVRRGGIALKIYEHSLSLAFLGMFLASFVLHARGSAAVYNAEQAEHGGPPTTFWSYLTSSELWFESFQNWQSEFLAIAAMVVLSIWLRERGSPESKPVAAPHSQTGDQG